MPALAVYATCLVIYALTASAATGWLDAPELIAASSSLGIAHSPGHPLVVMIGKFATLIPIGDIPFRVSLASAFAGAGAGTAVFGLLRCLLCDRSNSRSGTLTAAAGAFVASFAWALWFQGVRAEVYALQSLLVAGLLWSAFSFHSTKRLRSLLLFALLSTLAAINHPAIAATAMVPSTFLVLGVLWRTGTGKRGLALGISMIPVGLVSILYLPVRATANPALNWGDPQTFGRLWWTVSGRAFHKSAGAEHVSTFGQDFAQSLVATVNAATIPLALLALAGIYLAVRNRKHLAVSLVLIAVAALSLGGRAVLGFDPETPDHHAYLVPAIVALIVLGLLGVKVLVELVESSDLPSALAWPSTAIAIGALSVVQFATNWERSDLADVRASDRLLETELAAIPPRALVLSAYFETRFQLHVGSEVFGARPDVTVLDRSFLTYPGGPDSEARRHPELEGLIRAPLAAGSAAPLALLDEQSQKRAVLVELHPNVDRELRKRLAPLGAFALYLASETESLRERLETLDQVATENLARSAVTDVQFDGERAMISFVWRDYQRMELYCELERKKAAATTAARLRAVVPNDATFAAAEKSCGIGQAP